MSEPLTMSAEREAEIRDFEYKTEATKDVLSELDAERAAHKRTQDAWILPLRTMEAALGTLDHSEAVDETALASTVERQVFAAVEQLRHSREVSTALAERLKGMLRYRAHDTYCEINQTDFCNCGLMQAAADALAAIALAERDSSAAKESA